MADASASIVAFYCLLLAAIILIPFLICNKNNRIKLKILTKKQWGFGFISGLFLAAHYVLWFESLRYTSVASSTDYSTQTWLSFIGLAFIANILGQTIFNWLLKWMSATVISMSILGETIGTCILTYFILNETISLQ